METWEYKIESIDGDYAHLRRVDVYANDLQENDLKLVARALLPADISEGMHLKYELFEYSIIY